MDTPEQQPKEPAKHSRVRLASPRKQLERTIQKMTKASEIPMKPEKLVDLLTTLAGIQVNLLDMDRDAKKDALIEEIEQLKSELAARPTNNERDELKSTLELRNAQLKALEREVETLKSQNVKLQAENTELATINNGFKSVRSKLDQLELENGELRLTIAKLESRTPEELIAEVNAKLKEKKCLLGGETLA